MAGLLTRGLAQGGPLVTRGLGGGAVDVALDLRAALALYLRADATLVALLGGTARVHPGWRPQNGALPAITYEVDRNALAHHLRGRSGYREAQVTLVCWAETWAQAVALKQRLEDLLDGFVGAWSNLHINPCLQDDETDSHVWLDDGLDAPLARLAVTFTVRHQARAIV